MHSRSPEITDMHETRVMARRWATSLLLSPLAALCLSAPHLTLAEHAEQEKVAAEKVARKVEIAGNDMFYQAISRNGGTIDHGALLKVGGATALPALPVKETR